MTQEELPGDASTLIYLAKADVFQEASACVDTILVPPAVWLESVEEGERLGYPDAARIRDAERAGTIRRVQIAGPERTLAGIIGTQHRLGRGESEVLALAEPLGRALVDEGRASRVARALGIVPISSLFLPVLGRRRRELDESDAIGLLRSLGIVTGARAEAVYAIESLIREDAQ